MLVPELKEEVKRYNKEELTKIIIELYKRIPKSIKEDYDIDSFVRNITEPTVGLKKDKTINMDQLVSEVNMFVLNADAGNYLYGRAIPKSKRSKWRFEVKRYIKELSKISVNSPNGSITTELLMKIYNVLSEGCAYTLFSTDDPFRSVQIDQCEFLDMIISRKLREGITEDNLQDCIDLFLNSEVDRNTLHIQINSIFVSNFKTSDSRQRAIDLLEDKRKELDRIPPKKNEYLFNGKDYKTREKINNLTETVLMLYINSYEYDNGIKYFEKNYLESKLEIKKYVLLNMLEMYDLKDEWIKEYEKVVSKIGLRESLQDTYKYLKKHNKFSG